MFLLNFYRFFIAFSPDFIEEQVEPINDKLTFVDEKRGLAYERKITTSIAFKGSTYSKILAQKRSAESCEEIKIRIENRYELSDPWQTCFDGYIKVIDFKFDISRCVVTCTLIRNTPYDCIDKKKSDNRNLWLMPRFEIGTLPTANGVVYESETCIENGNLAILPQRAENCITNINTWTEISNELEYIDPGPPAEYSLTTKWGRAKFTGATPPTGSGWVSIGTNEYARPLTSAEIISFNANQSGSNSTIYPAYKLQWILEWFGGKECWKRPNGVDTCAEGGAAFCNFEVVSNFFSINADGTAPNNQIYQQATNKLKHLFLMQKSDILRSAIATQEASPKINFEQLMNDLKVIFDVDYWIEPQQVGLPKMRIEHSTYKNRVLDLNLLQPQFSKDILGFQQQESAKDKLPKTEIWKWFESTDRIGDFDSGTIEYDSNCTDTAAKDEFQTSILMTNFSHLLNQIPSITTDTDPNEFEGFCLVASNLQGNNFSVSSEVGELSGLEQINGHLAWANLLSNYHRNGRVEIQGKLNNADTIFSSVRAKNNQVPLTVTLCRKDFFERFDMQKLCKTQFGWGEVQSVTYEEPSQQLTLQVRH
jgi:hypothetical protein